MLEPIIVETPCIVASSGGGNFISEAEYAIVGGAWWNSLWNFGKSLISPLIDVGTQLFVPKLIDKGASYLREKTDNPDLQQTINDAALLTQKGVNIGIDNLRNKYGVGERGRSKTKKTSKSGKGKKRGGQVIKTDLDRMLKSLYL